MQNNNLKFKIFSALRCYFSLFTFRFKFNKGFTLLETLVAISILALALAGILSLSSVGIRASASANNQIKAFFLANEGMEYIRNKRDSNIIEGLDWMNGLDVCAGGCDIDVFSSGYGITACSGGVCPKIRLNENENRYDYENESRETIFTRKITISSVAGHEVRMTSKVSWLQGDEERSVLLEENLFDLSF